MGQINKKNHIQSKGCEENEEEEELEPEEKELLLLLLDEEDLFLLGVAFLAGAAFAFLVGENF